MKVLMLYRPDCEETGAMPEPEHMEAMGKYIEESMRKGVLLQTGGLLGSASAARVRLRAGQVSITDGPFPETREIIGGFAIVCADSLEHAKQLATEFLSIAGDGETEIRPMMEMVGA